MNFSSLMSLRNSRNYSSEVGGAFLDIIIFSIILSVAVWLAPNYTLGLLSAYLVVDEEPKPADAIIVLLSSGAPERVVKAARLLEQGLAPRVIFGSGLSYSKFTTRAPKDFEWPRYGDIYKKAFRSLGVSGSEVVVVDAPDAFDTDHELKAISRFMRNAGWTSAILVTSSSHTRRVSLIWRRVAPDIEASIIAAPQKGFKTWWKSGNNRRAVGYEYAALVKELWSQVTYTFQGVVDTAEELQQEPAD